MVCSLTFTMITMLQPLLMDTRPGKPISQMTIRIHGKRIWIRWEANLEDPYLLITDKKISISRISFLC